MIRVYVGGVFVVKSTSNKSSKEVVSLAVRLEEIRDDCWKLISERDKVEGIDSSMAKEI